MGAPGFKRRRFFSGLPIKLLAHHLQSKLEGAPFMLRRIMLTALGILLPVALIAQQPPSPAPGNQPAKPDFDDYNSTEDEFEAYKEIRESEGASDYNAHRYKLLVDAFERPEEWRGEMGRDEGYITVKRIYAAATQIRGGGKAIGETESHVATPPRYRTGEGRYESRYFEDLNYPPSEAPDIAATGGYDVRNARTLGVKVTFFKRGINTFAVYPPNPVFLEGVARGFEVYVLGKNAKHRLFILLRDMHGNDIKVSLGALNFQGWKRLRVPIPSEVRQARYVNGYKRGLEFRGFYVVSDIDTSYGTFYLYFDNMSVTIDRYWEETQDPAEPLDVW